MHPGRGRLEEFEPRLKKLLLELSPSLDSVDVKLLRLWLTHRVLTPYRASRLAGMNIASMYRRAERLLARRLLIPSGGRGLAVSVKGCISLYVNGEIGLKELASCVSRVWGVDADVQQLAGFLYLLGLEAKRRKLTLQTLTICRVDEAAIHVARYLRRVLDLYSTGCCGFREALDRVAEEAGLEPRLFREALRLALRGLATSLPITIADGDHVVAVLVHGGEVYTFVLSCRRPCSEYVESLGFQCPLAQALAKARLGAAYGKT